MYTCAQDESKNKSVINQYDNFPTLLYSILSIFLKIRFNCFIYNFSILGQLQHYYDI